MSNLPTDTFLGISWMWRGESCHVFQCCFLADNLGFLNTIFNSAAVGSKPSMDPGIHSTLLPETNLLN